MRAGGAALAFLHAGRSVIPTRREDKRPLIPWKEFQSRRASEAEV